MEGEQPLPRRGHVATSLADLKKIIIFGGCYGYNSLLDDTFVYDVEVRIPYFSILRFLIKKRTFTAIPKSESYYPDARAWHSGTLIGNKIYYFGGMKANYEFTNEILMLDVTNWQWDIHQFDALQESVPTPRCAHCCLSVDSK